MAQYSYEQAVQVLKERLGDQWEASEADGRAGLARELREGLGIPQGVADDLVDALVESGQLRYVREQAIGGGMGAVIPGAPAAGMGGSPTGSGTGGTPGVPAVPVALAPGYWQIGSGSGSERGAGTRIAREGQVDPTA